MGNDFIAGEDSHQPLEAIRRSRAIPGRSSTLVAAFLASLTLLLAGASSASALSIGLGWMNYSPAELEIVKRSGATHYRLPIDQAAPNWVAHYDPIFQAAWERGITISPYLVRSNGEGTRFLLSSDPGWGSWYTWTKAVIRRYGYNGEFWAGKANPRPVATWEVWNEPNLYPNNPMVGGQEKILPHEYASFLIYTAAAIQAGSQEQSGGGTQVLFAGLYMSGTANYPWFLEKAYEVPGLYSSYHGLSIHPYAFNGKMVEFTTEIGFVREKLNTLPWGPSRSLWITEMGWPLAGDAPTVTEAQQAELLTEAYNWVKGAAGALNIQAAFWYNIQDGGKPGKWATYCGLRDGGGGYRSAWWAFQKQTGAAPWPGPPTTTGPATAVQQQQATLNGAINPGGYSTAYHFEYGTTTEYGRSVPIPSANAGSGLSIVNVSSVVSGLLPGTTYHYRLVATHAGGTSYGANGSFTTTGYRYMRGLSSGAGISSWNTSLGMAFGPTEVGDFTGDGKADIVSVEYEGGNSYRYRLGTGSGSSVSAWSSVLSGMGLPANFDLGDFTGDGKADIVSVESEGNGKYRYMLGISSGSGVSSWGSVLSGMSAPGQLALGDFTGDGKADIVSVESEGNGKYRYMLGISSGSGVSSWGSVLSGMSAPGQLALGDFTGDGKADIVSVESEGNGKYRYMLGISSGSGVSSWGSVLSGMSAPGQLALGDFTGDGKADIVSVESEGNGKYRFMLGKSSGGGVSSWGSVLTGMSYAEQMDVADFNADGKSDIVSTEAEPGGSYRHKVGFSTGGAVSSWDTVQSWMKTPQRTDMGDFTGDGKADIVSVESEGAQYRYVLGASGGSGGVASWKTVLSGMGLPTAMAVADVNKDGKADIVSVEPEGGGKYRYMFGISSGSGVSSWTSVLSGMSEPTRFGVADVNADGKADIVAVEPAGGGSYRYMFGIGSGTGISSWSQVLGGMGYPHKMALGDFTGDGKADIVSVESEGGKYRYMRGVSSGSGISSWGSVLTGMSYSEMMDLGDVNKDGKADIVSVEAEGGGKYRYMFGISSGSGVSSWSAVLTGMGGPYFLNTGDIDGDGKADIVGVEQG